MMKSTIRASTPEDAQAITRLLAEAGLRPNDRPQDLWWKYWQPRADWSAPRSFVLMQDEQLVAHGGIVPGWGRWQSGPITLIHMIDWAARRDIAGAGTMLMKHVGNQAQGLLSVGGSERTLEVLPYLGFRPAAVATGYVRPLSVLQMLRGARPRSWRLLPRLLRGWLWSAQAPGLERGDWRAREVPSHDIASVAPVLPEPGTGEVAVLGRSAAMLQYMLACPIVPMRLFAVEKCGRLMGYFVLAYAAGQVRIADCWMQSRERADWRALLMCAVAQAHRDPGAAEVVLLASDPCLAAAAEACGFRARFRLPVQLRLPRGMQAPVQPLGVRMLDSDAAFYHETPVALWA
jgi:hypothetical protein